MFPFRLFGWILFPEACNASVLLGMLWALASANFADRQQREQMEGAINRVDTYVQKQSLETVSQVDANTRAALQEFMQKDLGVLPNVAEGASPQRTLEIVDAGTKASVLIRAVPQQRRDALTIWVFTHVQKEVDFKVVRARLQIHYSTRKIANIYSSEGF
jgi:hypothetical protein